eukprot:scaffold2454_cov58-Attheya_sp.AAC.4
MRKNHDGIKKYFSALVSLSSPSGLSSSSPKCACLVSGVSNSDCRRFFGLVSLLCEIAMTQRGLSGDK